MLFIIIIKGLVYCFLFSVKKQKKISILREPTDFASLTPYDPSLLREPTDFTSLTPYDPSLLREPTVSFKI
jgi:hypothetical protein